MEWELWWELAGVKAWRVEGLSRRAGSRWQHRMEGEIWIWLNVEGEGVVWGQEDRVFLRPGMYAILGDDRGERWFWTRLPGRHRAVVLVIARPWLARRIGERAGLLHPDFLAWLKEGAKLAFAGLMTGPEKRLEESLRGFDPAVPGGAMLAESRVLEWAAVRLFRRDRADQGAGFCHQVGPAGMVERALRVLATRAGGEIQLAELARQCGASPTHLSRLVKRRTGRTLREHQRRLRIEAACELLREEDARVTEVALEVGYQSLSHFAKAFREETGKSPSEWRAG